MLGILDFMDGSDLLHDPLWRPIGLLDEGRCLNGVEWVDEGLE